MVAMIIGAVFAILWLLIICEMVKAPDYSDLWDDGKIDISDEDVMEDLNHGTEVTNTGEDNH
jgi:hypothetical protein